MSGDIGFRRCSQAAVNLLKESLNSEDKLGRYESAVPHIFIILGASVSIGIGIMALATNKPIIYATITVNFAQPHNVIMFSG